MINNGKTNRCGGSRYANQVRKASKECEKCIQFHSKKPGEEDILVATGLQHKRFEAFLIINKTGRMATDKWMTT